MKELRIRNVPEETIVFLNQRAKAAGMSREEYMRRVLANMTAKDIIEETEEKYTSLVKTLVDVIVKERTDTAELFKEITDRLNYLFEFPEIEGGKDEILKSITARKRINL